MAFMSNGVKREPAAPSILALGHTSLFAPQFITCLFGSAVWILILVGCLFRGPRLGDHEVIVAQTARQMLLDRDWIVPHYLDTPFLVKPPLSYWCVALVSAVFPADAATGLPVTDATARLPSILATIMSVWIVWRLGRDMFGAVAGQMATIAYATSIGTLLFAMNGTSEALLTAFCTWSFAEAWWATQPGIRANRAGHQICFFVALALAMLAKGPMPLVVAVLPLAVWMALEAPLCASASGRWSDIQRAFRRTPSLAWKHGRALGIGWGWLLFLAVILPWAVAVYFRHPYVLALWRYEYLDRLEGNYPGCRKGDAWYYLPILLGLIAPWCLSIPQALASPFRKCHEEIRRPLMFVWCWVVVGLAACSFMSFKKPYYILPIIPGCALLLGPTLERFFRTIPISSQRCQDRLQHFIPGMGLAILTIVCLAGNSMLPVDFLGKERIALLGLVTCGLIGLAVATLWFARGARFGSFLALAATSFSLFTGSWMLLGRTVDNADDACQFATALEEAGVPKKARVVWCDARPDGRVTYYYDRTLSQPVDPYRAIVEHRQSDNSTDLLFLMADKIAQALKNEPASYFVFTREKLKLFDSVFHPAIREVAVVPRGADREDTTEWVVVTGVPAHAE